jgi:uncharacterized membrane protein YozB (DUF420 family)
VIAVEQLPALNASLNAVTAVLLVTGWSAVRRGSVRLHKGCMIAAISLSVVFLASYLTYHFQHGTTRFLGTGWRRPVYFTILVSHTVLAAVNLPMVVITVARAARGRWEAHRRIARKTAPLWLYVAVTGPLVYLMLRFWSTGGNAP